MKAGKTTVYVSEDVRRIAGEFQELAGLSFSALVAVAVLLFVAPFVSCLPYGVKRDQLRASIVEALEKSIEALKVEP